MTVACDPSTPNVKWEMKQERIQMLRGQLTWLHSNKQQRNLVSSKMEELRPRLSSDIYA